MIALNSTSIMCIPNLINFQHVSNPLQDLLKVHYLKFCISRYYPVFPGISQYFPYFPVFPSISHISRYFPVFPIFPGISQYFPPFGKYNNPVLKAPLIRYILRFLFRSYKWKRSHAKCKTLIEVRALMLCIYWKLFWL